MATYSVDINGNITNNKKKKKKSSTSSTYSVGLDGKIVRNTQEEEEQQEQEQERTWFKESEGNWIQTILGSAGDIVENAGVGLVGILEKSVDGMASIGASQYALQSGLSNEKSQKTYDMLKKSTTDFIMQDIVNEEEIIDNTLGKLNENLGIDTDANSVFGAKSDSLAQSGGQLLGQIGLQAVGVPWYMTTGFTSLGSEVESSLGQGASYEQALGSGLITAGADILTEKLFGGSGLGEKGLINLEPLTKGITNKVVKSLADFGVDVLAEGSEEVIAGVMSNLGSSLYKEENAWELLTNEEAIDGYIESFIGGAVLGGGANAVNVGKSIKNKTDYRTGVTENEQKVLDKVVESRVKKAEEGGKKLTKKERTEIEQDVLNSLQRGEIDLDTIESTFGGERYSQYDALKKEADEYNTLYETESGKLSEKQKDRLAELKAKNTENSYENRLFEAKSQLTQEVQKATEKDGFLQESYGEYAKRGETFKLSEKEKKQFTAEEMKIVNKAIESGDINNTRKAHDMVSFVAKLSAQTKTDFDFTNNKKLAEAGYIVEGKTIDGFKEGNKIAVNLQSKKALNTVVGHEITHVLEGTDLYTALQSTLKKYATTKGVYDSLFDKAKENYKNVYKGLTEAEYNKKIEQEVTADLVGDYIFSDTDFVRNLSTKNPNVFQKVFNEIKHMLKLVTAGSDAEKQLLKAKKIFEDVYRDTKRNTSEEVQYALQNNTITKDTDIPYVIHQNYHNVPVNDTKALSKLQNDVRKIKRGTFENKATGYKADINSDTIGKIINPTKNFNAWNPNYNYIENLNASLYLPELFENAVYVDSRPPQKTKNAGKQIKEFHHFVAPIEMNNGDYRVLITAREKVNSNTLYVVNVEILPNQKRGTQLAGQTPPNMLGVPRTIKIADLVNGVNIYDYNLQKNQTYTDKDIQFAVSDLDTEYMQAVENGDTETAQKMVDEVAKKKGYTIKAYHGTNADFFTFDKGRVGKGTDQYGAGFYFASDKSASEHYGKRIIDTALKLENPYVISSRNLLDADITLTEEQAYEVVKRHPMMYDAEESPLGDYYDSYWEDGVQEWMIQDLASKYTDLGYLDSDLFRDYPNELHEAIRDVTGHDGIVVELESGDKFYIAWFDNQMKTSDVVTRDENGNVIPLSERFDSNKNDIRYSLSDNQDIAPMPNGIYGKDVMLDIAPTVENTSQTHDKGTKTHEIAPSIAPQTENERYEVHASEPLPLPQGEEVRGVRMDAGQPPRTPRETPQGKLRRWTETSTESEVVNREILPEDLDQSKIYYEPISNKKTLDTANADLDRMGYDKALEVFNAKLENRTVSLSDIALGERLVQESLKRGDTKTTGELIQNIAILGTELGQKVQALSIIQRMTPEGQLKMLQKVVNRGKAKGDRVFDGVEITQEMIDKILSVYGKDGTYDQNRLNEAVEQVKQDIADQMSVSKMDKVNAWRYLAMLGNPKTHIRNIVSNITMQATTEIKDLVARTTETLAPIKNRTKTFKQATDVVKRFAEQSTAEAKAMLTSENSYSESADIKSKRDVFKTKILQKAYDFNNDLMTKEDWWFKKARYKKSLQEFLTANGIKTQEDINNNPELVEKGKKYATEQAQIATFQQTSWLANKINEIERKNVATQVGVGAILPFKKTPINIAKTGLAYSPLGFAKSLTYDLHQMKKGNIEASQVIDNLAKGVTGSALVYIGYMLAMSGLLNGGGEDDKEGKYDYQLGEQSYSLNFGGSTYSLNWLTPVAMPLFIGANAFEMFEEDKELSFDTTSEALAQTLDPLSEMSFLSSLDSVLTSYESGMGKFAGIGEAMLQNYVTQFAPTLMSQVAQVTDDTKRSTTVAGDSDARIIEQTINKLKYKIPGLRQTLEPTIDIWGNEVKQTENVMARAFETFIAPYSRKDNIATEIDAEIKEVYSQTGDNGVIPTVPNKKVQFKGETYKMSADEYTDYKKVYGQLANDTLEDLFKTSTYQNSDAEDKAELVNRVYKYASDEAKKDYLAKEGVEYTNTTEDNVPVYKTDKIKGAIDNDMTLEEFDLYNRSAGKYYISKVIGGYDTYKAITSSLGDIEADKDIYGKAVSNSRKYKVASYLNNLDADYYTKIMMFKAEYPSDDRYNGEIINYLNEREDISYQEMSDILTELGFTVTADGKIRW